MTISHLSYCSAEMQQCEGGCSQHGDCVEGVCKCTGDYSGPTCNSMSLDKNF